MNEEFALFIEDMEGNTIIDEKVMSPANGFIDLWLPRDKEYNISLANNGKTAEAKLSTFKGDKTCITTIQLTP